MSNNGKSVLVLGGTGMVGEAAVRLLAERGRFARIIVAGRNRETAEKIAQSITSETVTGEAAVVDLMDHDAIVQLMSTADVVLNTSGPFYKFGLSVMNAAAESGTPYADILDDLEPVKELFADKTMDEKAKAAGIPMVVTLGTTPGLSNIVVHKLAAELDHVKKIQVALATGPWTRGEAVWAHHLHITSEPVTIYRGNKWITVPAMSEEETLHFPWNPSDPSVYIIGHPEPLTLPYYYPEAEEVVMKLGHPDPFKTFYRTMAAYGLSSKTPVKCGSAEVSPSQLISAWLMSPEAEERFHFTQLKPYSLREIRVEGTKNGETMTLVSQMSTPGGPRETALTLVVAGEMLADSKIPAGLMAPEALEPAPFLAALPVLGEVHMREIRNGEIKDLF